MASSSDWDSFAAEACCQERKKKSNKKILYRKSLGVYQDELLIAVQVWNKRVFLPLQYGSGGCSRTHGRPNPTRAEREAKIKRCSFRAQLENLRHRACLGQSSWAAQHLDSAWVQTYKSLMKKVALPRFYFPGAVTCMDKQTSTSLQLPWKESVFVFCSPFPPGRHTPADHGHSGTTFPRLTLHCDLCPHTVLAAGSLFLPQSSSSPELFCQDERLLSGLHGVVW